MKRFKEKTANHFQDIVLPIEDVRSGAYLSWRDTDPVQWDAVGRWQLAFLERLGLTPQTSLADIGCGPIRAGEYFIRYLDAGKYYGCDFNADLIEGAREVVRLRNLEDKAPILERVGKFKMTQARPDTRMALAFSVVQHCTPPQRAAFLKNVPRFLPSGCRVIVTHAFWFKEAMLDGTGFEMVRWISEEEIGLPLYERPGGKGRPNVFPAVELRIR